MFLRPKMHQGAWSAEFGRHDGRVSRAIAPRKWEMCHLYFAIRERVGKRRGLG